MSHSMFSFNLEKDINQNEIEKNARLINALFYELQKLDEEASYEQNNIIRRMPTRGFADFSNFNKGYVNYTKDFLNLYEKIFGKNGLWEKSKQFLTENENSSIENYKKSIDDFTNKKIIGSKIPRLSKNLERFENLGSSLESSIPKDIENTNELVESSIQNQGDTNQQELYKPQLNRKVEDVFSKDVLDEDYIDWLLTLNPKILENYRNTAKDKAYKEAHSTNYHKKLREYYGNYQKKLKSLENEYNDVKELTLEKIKDFIEEYENELNLRNPELKERGLKEIEENPFNFKLFLERTGNRYKNWNGANEQVSFIERALEELSEWQQEIDNFKNNFSKEIEKEIYPAHHLSEILEDKHTKKSKEDYFKLLNELKKKGDNGAELELTLLKPNADVDSNFINYVYEKLINDAYKFRDVLPENEKELLDNLIDSKNLNVSGKKDKLLEFLKQTRNDGIQNVLLEGINFESPKTFFLNRKKKEQGELIEEPELNPSYDYEEKLKKISTRSEEKEKKQKNEEWEKRTSDLNREIEEIKNDPTKNSEQKAEAINEVFRRLESSSKLDLIKFYSTQTKKTPWKPTTKYEKDEQKVKEKLDNLENSNILKIDESKEIPSAYESFVNAYGKLPDDFDKRIEKFTDKDAEERLNLYEQEMRAELESQKHKIASNAKGLPGSAYYKSYMKVISEGENAIRRNILAMKKQLKDDAFEKAIRTYEEGKSRGTLESNAASADKTFNMAKLQTQNVLGQEKLERIAVEKARKEYNDLVELQQKQQLTHDEQTRLENLNTLISGTVTPSVEYKVWDIPRMSNNVPQQYQPSNHMNVATGLGHTLMSAAQLAAAMKLNENGGASSNSKQGWEDSILRQNHNYLNTGRYKDGDVVRPTSQFSRRPISHHFLNALARFDNTPEQPSGDAVADVTKFISKGIGSFTKSITDELDEEKYFKKLLEKSRYETEQELAKDARKHSYDLELEGLKQKGEIAKYGAERADADRRHYEKLAVLQTDKQDKQEQNQQRANDQHQAALDRQQEAEDKRRKAEFEFSNLLQDKKAALDSAKESVDALESIKKNLKAPFVSLTTGSIAGRFLPDSFSPDARQILENDLATLKDSLVRASISAKNSRSPSAARIESISSKIPDITNNVSVISKIIKNKEPAIIKSYEDLKREYEQLKNIARSRPSSTSSLDSTIRSLENEIKTLSGS